MPKVAIIGAGINGLCTAIECAEQGIDVELFDRGVVCGETSNKSSRMLHGGIRYLEQGHVKLVCEALRERSQWLCDYPDQVAKVEFLVFPHRFNLWQLCKLYSGVKIYEWLALGRSMGASRLRRSSQLPKQLTFKPWSVSYTDLVMNDRAIVAKLHQRALEVGIKIHEHCEVQSISKGGLNTSGAHYAFDAVINTAGPWASELNQMSGSSSNTRLRYVRGAHLVLKDSYDVGYGCLFIQPDGRVVFLVPSPRGVIWGTTEFEQDTPEVDSDIRIDIAYLTKAYQRAFGVALPSQDIVDTFAGVRPIVCSEKKMTSASRDAVIEDEQVLTLFGGKWTSARANALKIATKLKARLRLN